MESKLWQQHQELTEKMAKFCVDPDFNVAECLEFQDLFKEVTHIQDMLRQARERSVRQVVYNERMLYNYDIMDDKLRLTGEYLFLTVNPQPMVGIERFKSICWHFMKHNQTGMYVIEQRSDNDMFHGWHGHFILKRKKTSKKEIVDYFTPYVGNPKHIRIGDIPNTADLKRRCGYMLGEKVGADKQVKQAMDKEFRRQYNIDNQYVVGQFETPYLLGSQKEI